MKKSLSVSEKNTFSAWKTATWSTYTTQACVYLTRSSKQARFIWQKISLRENNTMGEIEKKQVNRKKISNVCNLLCV
jgi:hypothetical protein